MEINILEAVAYAYTLCQDCLLLSLSLLPVVKEDPSQAPGNQYLIQDSVGPLEMSHGKECSGTLQLIPCVPLLFLEQSPVVGCRAVPGVSPGARNLSRSC